MSHSIHIALRSVLYVVILVISGSPLWSQNVSRLWSDKSGKFSVQAELISHDDKGVRLRKSDGRVITVPIDRLSDADVAHVRALDEDSENPFSGGVPMADSPPAAFPQRSRVVELSVDGTAVFLNVDETMPALEPDPGRHPVRFAPFARPIEQLDAYARVSHPILIDPSGPTFAVSTHRNGNAVNPANFGKIYHVSQADRQAKRVFESDETLMLLSHHVDYDRSIAMVGVESPSDRGGDLVVLQGLAAGQPQIISRWHLPGWQKPGFKPKAEFASMIDDARAIVQVNSSLYCWSLDEGICHWVIDRVPAGGKVTSSSGGRYVAVPVSGGVQMIDAARGELIGKIPFQGSLTPETRFSPDGSRVALAAGNQITVWNLVSAGIELEDTVGSTLGRLVGWVGDDALLTQFALIDLELAQSVWKYHLPSGAKEQTVPGGYVSVDKNARPATLISVPMPHGAIDQVKNKLKNAGDEMLLLGPGGKVSLKIQGIEGVDESAMEAALREAVERAGWRVDPSSKIQVVATITRGEKQKLSFRKIGTPLRGAAEEVTLKPYRASLEVVHGGNTLWQRSSQNMVPFLIRLKDGQSVKQAVKSYEKADPEYFKRVTIPPKIFKPEHRKIVGQSRLQNGRWVDL